MMDRILFSNTKLQMVKKALDVYADRGRVHARNVANAETPGYRAQEVRFEENLQLAMRTSGEHPIARTNPGHLGGQNGLPGGTLAFRNPTSAFTANGVNDVEIDREMADIAENTLKYDVAAEFARRAYSAMKKAIHGRPMS